MEIFHDKVLHFFQWDFLFWRITSNIVPEWVTDSALTKELANTITAKMDGGIDRQVDKWMDGW